MKITTSLIVLALSTGLITSSFAHAEETVGEKAAATATKAKNATKKAYRGAKDEVCEMINGKMECLPQKVKHKAENAADSAEAKAKELKNKVD